MGFEKAKDGRNDPCPCGSGLKYKKCCLDKDNEGDFHQAEESGHVKMSEVIIEFADDLLRHAPTPSEEEMAISIAIIAWNMSLMEESELAEARNRFADTIDDREMSGHMLALLDALIEKKMMEYPHIKRFIVDFICTNPAEGLQFNVTSVAA